MGKRRQRNLWIAAVAFGSILLTYAGSAGEATKHPSAKDEDAFILYRYALLDAQVNRSSEITANTEGNRTVYRYSGHALSCKTVMTGSMTNTAVEGKTHFVGEFAVSNNSYGIEELSFDFHDDGSKVRTGTMTVDGKVIDIDQFDHR